MKGKSSLERTQKNILIFLIISLFAYTALSQEGYCDGTSFTIEDSPEMNAIISQVRISFLSSRPTPISDLYITMLVPTISPSNSSEIIWKRGSFDPYDLMYPASVVKLGYMPAAVQFCLDHDKPADCLDSHVRPMIKDSDNVQTGIVVDICSGAPNINLTSTSDILFNPWYEKRSWAENYLSSHSLLGNQSLSLKTYPSNTGQNLWGAENLSYEIQRNSMNSLCAASLMLEIVMGGLFPMPSSSGVGPTEYMKQLLDHQRFNSESSIGFGLPPGALLLNKIGVAYNNLNDIAYVQLASGKYFILSIFSTGYEPDQPYPYDGSNLGVLAEMLIDGMELNIDDPVIIKKSVSSQESYKILEGVWLAGNANDAYLDQFLYSDTDNSILGWTVDIPKTNLYEICVWSPQSSYFSATTQVTVVSYVSTDTYTLPQNVLGGRWVKLGDFYLEKGINENIITIAQNGTGNAVANAIKLTMWPECRHSPGALCSDFPN